jgi:hypothetical protein
LRPFALEDVTASADAFDFPYFAYELTLLHPFTIVGNWEVRLMNPWLDIIFTDTFLKH